MPDGPHDDSDRVAVSRQDLALFAHEVRGALTVISGFAEIMRRPLAPTDQRAALDGIARAVQRIDGLVQAALEGSVRRVRPAEQVDLAGLVEAVASEQRAISGRLIETHLEARPVVSGASDAIERAIGNLVGNALKYSLMNSVVELTVAEKGDRALVTVADRGPGIPTEERERVLEPFHRLDAHGDLPGSGLGLAVVKDVAESHGGRVLIEERPGGGTLVTIELAL